MATDTAQKDEATERAEQTLSRLIAEQGVKPVSDLDELSELWPGDDDADELMDFVLKERESRKQLHHESVLPQ